MARMFLAAITIGALYLTGCNSAELVALRASNAKLRQDVDKAQDEAVAAKEHAKRVATEAQGKLARAEMLCRDATSLEAAAESRLVAARAAERAGQKAKKEAEALRAATNGLKLQTDEDRAEIVRQIAEARAIIEEAAKASIEAENAKAISAEVERLATAAREDRATAERALAEVSQTRAMILAESKAAAKEQEASKVAIDAARLEKLAAEEAVEAARLAKLEISKDRTLLTQERNQLAAAQEDIEQRNAAVVALLAKAETKKLAAEQARSEAVQQQLELEDRIAAFDAAKQAAAISEAAAAQTLAQAAAERKAGERARAAADEARQESLSAGEYIRSVLQQLRDAQTNMDGSLEGSRTSTIRIAPHVAERTAIDQE